MLYYHGNNEKDFTVNPHKNARYGFPALFFTPNIDLARLYAVHHYRKTQRHGGGFVYAIELPDTLACTRDWQNQSTHTPQFKNLICQAATGHIDLLQIKNCLDYPSKELRLLAISDILVCFDTQIITEIGMNLIESGIMYA